MMTKASLEKLFNRPFSDTRDNWKAKCPFHGGGNERTPSFYVHKEENIAHCFGCDISGYIAKLGALATTLSEVECEQALGITLQEKVQGRIDRANNRAAGPTKPTRFPESWLAPWRKEVHPYVLGRNFTLDTLRRCESRYDRNKRRQVFPWRNERGDLRGATGRDCTDQSLAKWFHYWDFDRGTNLYTLPPLRQSEARSPVQAHLRSSGPLLVVEGIFDLLWVYQETGNEHITAPIGAMLTDEQAALVRGNSSRVTLAFDNDEAGIRGTIKAHRQLRRSCEVHIVDWPKEAKDWMDLDGDTIQRVLEQPLTYLQWTTKLRRDGQGSLLRGTKHSDKQKQEVRKRSVEPSTRTL